jgi:hypothetical protein
MWSRVEYVEMNFDPQGAYLINPFSVNFVIYLTLPKLSSLPNSVWERENSFGMVIVAILSEVRHV